MATPYENGNFIRKVYLLNKRSRLLIGGAIAALLVAYLIWSSFTSAAQANRSVGELVLNSEKYVGQPVRVTGKVVSGSIEKGGETIDFRIKEPKGGPELRLSFKGAMPNSFQDGCEVIADGELQKNGTFLVKKLLVKCPSKYTAEKKKE